jgi:hypothetical protein
MEFAHCFGGGQIPFVNFLPIILKSFFFMLKCINNVFSKEVTVTYDQAFIAKHPGV